MLRLYNSLTRQKEEFVPINPPGVRIYSCGPTVYHYVSIGNWRTYVLTDILIRTLKLVGFKPKFFMNITDVGHLTGDNLGDSSTGEDRMLKATKREGKNAWDIAKFYTDDFLQGYDELNMTRPKEFCVATNYIDEQIELVKKIEEKGLTYEIKDDGIYFDVKAYEATGKKYGELSDLDQVLEGARVEKVEGRRDPRDFALWKFNKEGKLREMEWDSPWGRGFPGWHIECSAMCLTNLGDQLDIHIGGEDLKSTHHPNEIAQSEAATGKEPFVKYWVHGAFLLVDGGRMGKSLGNAYNLHDLKERGYSALDLRMFYLTGHYRKQLNFTWDALSAAKASNVRLRNKLKDLVSIKPSAKDNLSSKAKEYQQKFMDALGDDLNIPQALAVLWSVIKDSEISKEDKRYLIDLIDSVFGLRILDKELLAIEIPQEVTEIADKRKEYRQAGEYDKSDELRKKIEDLGFEVHDKPDGSYEILQLSK